MGIDFSDAGSLPLLLKSGLFIVLLLTASLIDIKKRIIPDTLCLVIALTGCILFEPVKLWGVLIAVPLLLAALLWGGMGGGDIKLMAAGGMVLGIREGMAAMVMGLAALLLFHAVYFIVQKLRGRECPEAYPLAPFLSIGCIAVYFMNTGGITL
ncbi:MAG: prepilin peptidase [Firmicutes bacterium]|nr:prepilin peptidase [Bacillota bacterium]